MSKLPLEGIRVIDHGIVYTGPSATTILADMGAEVIRIESIQVLLPFTRGYRVHPVKFDGIAPEYVDGEPGDRPWDRYHLLHAVQRNKYGITLDLGRPKGVELYKRLAEMSDVVVDNFAPGVMDRFGIGYADLKEVKPDIIMLSASGYGASGPYNGYSAVGASLGSFSGMASLRGYPADDVIVRSPGQVWSDNVAGTTAAFAVLAALHYRNREGRGQFIDLSQAECFLPHMGESILEYTMNGSLPEAIGNRDSAMAPHGCYRCLGEDRWVVIAVSSEEEWRAFGEVIGSPAWTKEARFSDRSGRFGNQEALNERIAEWTMDKDPFDVMHMLQRVGVAASPVMKQADLFDDPHLKERGFFQEVVHREAGNIRVPGMGFKYSKTPLEYRMPANCLGEHNDYVYGELLGLSREEIEGLEQENYIGDAFLPDLP
ncbi:MAG: CoA transferase [Proteobacteria bacterium]|nr:CoA transferase [Pseudomonadota bacterium]